MIKFKYENDRKSGDLVLRMDSSTNHAVTQYVPGDGYGYPQFTSVYKMGYQNGDISTYRTIKTEVTLVRVTGGAKLLLNQKLTDSSVRMFPAKTFKS